MSEMCICCASGNDLPDGERCECCGRVGGCAMPPPPPAPAAKTTPLEEAIRNVHGVVPTPKRAFA